jgi:positive regulator of sigma E activity
MSDEKQPLRLILIGFVLLLLGAGFPFLMVMQLIESTFWLNFLSFAASVAGLFLGFIGATLYMRAQKDRDRNRG